MLFVQPNRRLKPATVHYSLNSDPHTGPVSGEPVSDRRTLVPLDKQTILESVAKTGHLVVADPAAKVCSAASEIMSIVGEEGFWDLQAPM